MAYLGGIMLVALIFLTCISVAGRSLNGWLHSDFIEGLAPGFASWALGLGIGPVNGDFELIEAGVAFSIFAFLPLCQISGGHASVDVFTSNLSPRKDRILRFITDLVFALVMLLLAVQLYSGLQSKMRSGQTTFLIEFPLWWAYALSMVGAATAAVVAIYVAIIRGRELISGQPILSSGEGADQ